jgi:hypothetical protein
MRRDPLPLLASGCILALLLACFGTVLLRGEQFAYRDSAYFYYPLYLHVQQEWSAGRWPLWSPGVNGGVPLLGNPAAAVLYPGKVIYALLPYAWGARLYVVAHVIIALLGAVALGRSLGVSRTGSFLGGLGYAFGGPVLFQYSNVIFLVGAAWVPWGLRAIDRLLRQGRRPAGVELAAVLALQVLGGDPEAAYLTGACGAGYAVVLARAGRRDRHPLLTAPRALGIAIAWAVAVLILASARPVLPLAGAPWVLAAWSVAGLVLAVRWRLRPGEARLAPMLARLAGAGAAAAAVAAAQVLPTVEFAARSTRMAADASHPLAYRFSLEPYRLVELAWPGAFGTPCPEPRSWLQAIPPAGDREPWADSLYMGGLVLTLALGAAGWRGGPPWRAWLTAVALVSLAASFGRFAGPLWWARWLPGVAFGPHDPPLGQVRGDALLVDGAGSPYGLLAALLPGFGAFRYPGKLLTFAAAATAALAGMGWDRLAAGEAARARRLAGVGLGASLAGLAAAAAASDRVVALLSGRVPPDPLLGPADVVGAWAETQRALAHGAIVFAAVLALARWAPRRPRAAGAAALLLLTVDLALADAGLVRAAPQDEFDATPEASRWIAEAERADPSPGPFRVHRAFSWYPSRDRDRRSPGRVRELLAWERGTLRPFHGLPLGLEYCVALGTLELDDFVPFLASSTMPATGALARALGIPSGYRVRHYARRGFDLLGARYFILPADPAGWQDQDRGYASFLPETDLIFPPGHLLAGPGGAMGQGPWAVDQDWQLRRNRSAFPRAWVVHDARVRAPAAGPDDRDAMMGALLFMNDPIWSDPDREVLDLRATALIETDDRDRLLGSLAPGPAGPSEAVVVVAHGPQRVEIKATLERPGLVILADAYYPGWRLTIDGKPAPIYRANRLMRGAAVPAGEHVLVYTYEPRSFRIGLFISVGGVVALLIWAGSSWRARPIPLQVGG